MVLTREFLTRTKEYSTRSYRAALERAFGRPLLSGKALEQAIDSFGAGWDALLHHLVAAGLAEIEQEEETDGA